ncbi:MAG: hypothetical protein ACLR5Y_06660 [Haemophilus parainfluenzae]
MIAHCSTNLHYLTRKALLVKHTALMMMASSILMITQRWRQSHHHYDFPLTKDEPWVKWNMVVSFLQRRRQNC